jgi:hypothetical protein
MWAQVAMFGFCLALLTSVSTLPLVGGWRFRARPLTGFVEIQPGYAFGGGGSFFYYVKLGVNYGF